MTTAKGANGHAVKTPYGQLLRKGATVQLYTFATAHNLFQGSELARVLHSLVSGSESGRVTIIDEGIYGPIPLDPAYELQLEDLRFAIDGQVRAGGARVVFGDNEDLCMMEAVAPRFLRLPIITLRSRNMLTVALAELAKDESVPALVLAGVSHIAQISAILRREGCGMFTTNDILEVMMKSAPDPAEYRASAAGLSLLVGLAAKSQKRDPRPD